MQPCRGGEPHEVASGTHDVVLRALRALRAAPRYRAVDERYERLFNSYYYTVGEMHPRGRARCLEPTDRHANSRLSFPYRRGHAGVCSRSRPDDPELAAVVELGLHHEQQHQELLLTDAKQVLVRESARRRVSRRCAAARAGTVPLEFHLAAGGVRRDRRRRERLRFRQRAAAPSRVARSACARQPARHQRRVSRSSSAPAATRRRSCGSRTAGPRFAAAAGIGRSAGRRISSASTRSAAGGRSTSMRRSAT